MAVGAFSVAVFFSATYSCFCRAFLFGTVITSADDRQPVDAPIINDEPLLQRLPEAFLVTLNARQLAALKGSLAPPRASPHRVDFRVSLPWFGGRYYVVLLAGDERRSVDRLRLEGQLTVGRIAATYSAAMFMVVTLLIVSGAGVIFSISKLTDDAPSGSGYRRGNR